MLQRLEKGTYNLYRAVLRGRSNPVPELPGISEIEPRRRLTISPIRRRVAAVVVAGGLLMGGGYGGYEFSEARQDEANAAAVDSAMEDLRVSSAALMEAERAAALTEEMPRAERFTEEAYIRERVAELRAEHGAAEKKLTETMRDSWK